MCIAGFSITENFLKTASFAINLHAVFLIKHCNITVNIRVNIRVNFRVNFENGGKENSEKEKF